jgi:tRNA-dihydrouridine synthase A
LFCTVDLVRLISSETLLYTEMVAANAIAHEKFDAINRNRQMQMSSIDETGVGTAAPLYHGKDDDYLLRYLGQAATEPYEGPCVLQLGGADVEQMKITAATALELGNYTAFNLNCGCPSPTVAGKGCFGAALMEDPYLVAQLARGLHDGCEGRLPVTVKCRIGTDLRGYHTSDEALYGNLCRFVEQVAADGIVTDFSVHARIAVLSRSMTPAKNRKIPPLRYDMVRRLVSDYPQLKFTLNGGISTLEHIREQMEEMPGLMGCMVGRAFAADPWRFAMADSLLYNKGPCQQNRWQILQAYGRHADFEEQATMGSSNLKHVRRFALKAITHLFNGEPNSRRYRSGLDEIARDCPNNRPLSALILETAQRHFSEDVLFRSPEESYERRKENSAEQNAIVGDWQRERKAAEIAA